MSEGKRNHRLWLKLRWVLPLFCGVWLIGTIALDAAIAWQWYHQSQTKDWPVTHGVIDQYEVTQTTKINTSDRGPATSTMYHLKLAYSYEVAGQSYSNHRLRYEIFSGHNSPARVPAYHEGQVVRVYHHPDDPAASVLQKGVNDMDRAMVLFIIPFNVALAMMGLIFLSAKWRSKTANPRPNVTQAGERLFIRYTDMTPVTGGWIGLLFGSFAVAMAMILWLGTGPVAFRAGLIAIPCLGALGMIITWLALRQGAGSLVLDQRTRTLAIPKRGVQAARTIPVDQIHALELDQRPHPMGYEGIFTPVLIRQKQDSDQPQRLKLAQFFIRREATSFIQSLENALQRPSRLWVPDSHTPADQADRTRQAI